MPPDNAKPNPTTPSPSPSPDPGFTVRDFEAARREAERTGSEAGALLERQRREDIERLFVRRAHIPGFKSLCDELIKRGTPFETARDRYYEALETFDAAPVPHGAPATGDPGHFGAAVQRDGLDKWREGAREALLVRARLEQSAEVLARVRESEFRGMSLSDMARSYLQAINLSARGDRRRMIGEALVRSVGQHTTSDFTNLLANVGEKAALKGWEEAPETWAAWCKIGELRDFKSSKRVGLDSASDLDEIEEDGEYEYGTMSDRGETIQLKTYGKLFKLSRQSIINDDLGAFTDVPRKWGRAANRKVGDLVYAILSGNPTMGDGNSLWDASNHSNYVAGGSGAAPSITTLNAAFAAMATQTDETGNTINVGPRYIIGPAALRGTILTLLQSQHDPSEGNLASNPWFQALTPVIDPRIDADDAAKWYLAGDPAMFDTVEVAFLDGDPNPYIEQVDALTVDGVTYKVRVDCTAKALSWQALYHNDGN